MLEIMSKFAKNAKDTGSSMVQIALLTERIKSLTQHFQTHKKDFHSQRGLMRMISRRKKLLSYIKRTKPHIYQKTIQELNLRK